MLLASRLSTDYGRSKTFTIGQVLTAIKALKIKQDFIDLAMVVFCTAEDYRKNREESGFVNDHRDRIKELQSLLPNNFKPWAGYHFGPKDGVDLNLLPWADF